MQSVTLFSRCERIRKALEARGLDTSNSDYFYEGSPTPHNPKYIKATGPSEEAKVTTCLIQANDKDLEQKIDNAGEDRLGGSWSTVSSVFIEDKHGVSSSDIVLNLASVLPKGDERNKYGFYSRHVDAFRDMPEGCRLESIHPHNKGNENATTHFHVKCNWTNKNKDEVIDFIRDLWLETNSVSWYMSGEEMPTPKERKSKERVMMR